MPGQGPETPLPFVLLIVTRLLGDPGGLGEGLWCLQGQGLHYSKSNYYNTLTSRV